MGELRLYAIGIDELRGMIGAEPEYAQRLRAIATRAFAPAHTEARGGLLSRLGPLFRRVPGAPVISPTDPEPRDVELLLSGAYVPHERVGAAWRLLETLTAGVAWSATRMKLTSAGLDDLDFALARGGVSAAVGLRHLLTCATSLGLLPVTGLTVGWHPYAKALAMAAAYRAAQGELKTAEQQGLIAALVVWLDGFPAWAEVAAQLGRPRPDLIGFWAN